MGEDERLHWLIFDAQLAPSKNAVTVSGSDGGATVKLEVGEQDEAVMALLPQLCRGTAFRVFLELQPDERYPLPEVLQLRAAGR